VEPGHTNRAGGYRYYQDVIKGFSVTHFSGRGVSCYQDAPFMPIIGPITDSPGTHWSAYRPTISTSTRRLNRAITRFSWMTPRYRWS